MKLSELFQQNGFDLGNLKESFDLIDGISKHIIAVSYTHLRAHET